jgi:uncharacterized membrane protein
MWLYFALLSALLNGFANIARRTHGSLADPAELAWWLQIFAFPLSIGMLMISNQPAFTGHAFILPMIISGLLNATASTYQFKAYKLADASLVSPIANFLPLLMIPTSFLTLGVLPGWGAAIGILLVVLGVYYTSVSGKHALLHPLKQLLKNRGSRAMVLTILLWSISVNFEKISLQTVSPAFLMFGQGIIMFAATSVYLLCKPQRNRMKRGERVIRRWGWHISAISVFAFLSAFFQQSAVQLTPNPSYVLAVKRIDVLITVLLAGWFLREKHILKRFEGSLIAIAGVALIVIFG